jgi:protein-disulfide isomerase
VSLNSTPHKTLDPIVWAILAGVVLTLATSFLNMRELRRLEARVGALESQARNPVPAVVREGPDPSRRYAIDIATAPRKGPDSAPVTIAEFSEFQCPFCRRAAPTLKRIEEVYGGKVRIAWKNLPLTSIHEHAMGAALAAEAARNQGKFWEYHDKLFENQEHLEAADLNRYAQELDLDMRRFEADQQDQQKKKLIEADLEQARELKVSTTPSFFINGRYLRGALPFEALSKVIDEELANQGIAIPAKPRSS